MSALPDHTLRGQLHHLVSSRPGRGMSLDFICGEMPGFSRQQVRDSLKHLVKTGQLIRHGTIRYPLYQSLAPNGSLGVSLQIQTAASIPAPPAGKAPARVAEVIWPDGLKVQCGVTPARLRGQWQGVDWSHSVARPGCQDFLQIPSRRGDEWVAHRPAAGMRSRARNGMP